ncbi:hypothetical protein SCAR479_01558 [Seiridium cardinale]|uniref:Uncharacterized protein n=1 Tax=Seiridium cardinale TaxID=138064 RepID=A0ABR2Y5S6_9PEZI
MPKLLNLPFELRRMIMAEVILLRADAPQNDTEVDPLQEHNQGLVNDFQFTVGGRGHVTWMRRLRYNITINQLMLVNRQLYAEVTALIKQWEKQPTQWVLGMTCTELGAPAALGVTWVSVPILTDCVDTLTIEFRAPNSSLQLVEWMEYRHHAYFRSLIRSNCPCADQLFGQTLATILSRGPVPAKKDSCRYKQPSMIQTIKERGLKIKNLIIDFLPTTGEDMLPLDAQSSKDADTVHRFRNGLGPDWIPQPSNEELIDSQILCAHITKSLRRMIATRIDQPACWQSIKLFARVGNIEIRLAGQTQHHFNMQSALSTARHGLGHCTKQLLQQRIVNKLDEEGPMLPLAAENGKANGEE